MALRGRFQTRMMVSASAFPRLSWVFGSVLVVLVLVSFMTDLDDLPRHHAMSSVPVLQQRQSVEPSKVAHRAAVPAVARRGSETVWVSKLAKYYYGCSAPSNSFTRPVSESESNGYLLIVTSGGLNQQRTGIVDAVVVARILNATLVVPRLDHKSFWKDSSNFSDIFDVDWFIGTLAPDVPIIKELPSRFKGRPYSTRVPRKCIPDYFISKILPTLRKKKAIQLTKFDYRLSNRLEGDLQKLRCRVNYNALHFTVAIKTMGEILVERLRQRSGRYIALHLRFEPDMLAFSGCYYGGGEKERKELGLIRKRWKTLHQRNPDKQRRNGKCPLTPEEVGFMLRALGFQSDSYIYIASGEVYGGENTLAPLKEMFPNVYTKDSLATKEEIRPFSAYSSRMAAIDYIVCDESDVFVTNNNGNMARILAGRRRYFGHKRTIRPNAKRLGTLFLAKNNMTWNAFTSKLRRVQKGFMGEPSEVRPGRGQFFENPAACICQNLTGKEKLKELQQQGTKKPYEAVQGEEQGADLNHYPEPEEDSDQEDTDSNPDDEMEKEEYGFGRVEDLEAEDIPSLSD